MLKTPRLGGKRLADLCHRLAISAESGIDVRRTWQREADSARSDVRRSFAQVQQGVESGDSLSESLNRTGTLFPRLFREMVQVGEQTGALAEVLHRLSSHYQRQHEMARDLRRNLMWPTIQLIAAIVIVGILLAVLSALGAKGVSGKPIDVLGLGVSGGAALTLYAVIVSTLALAVAGVVYSVKRGMLWVKPMQHLVMKLPGLGPAIEQLCLARLAWALHLTLNVEMDLRQVAPLVLRATGSDYYMAHTKQITAAVAGGSPLHQAFTAAEVFPPHFLDSLYVAEESGQLVESLSRLSKQYEEEAESAMQTLTTIFGFAIWAMVSLLIGAIIYRVFKTLYIDQLNEALNF